MHYGAERLGCTVVPASGGRTQQQIMLLQDFGARILLSTPSYALNMAYTMAEMKIPAQLYQSRNRHLWRRTMDRRNAWPTRKSSANSSP
jgi:phenylacetate-coenzyme A ligase PaaK-like adenylate-forming protein